MGNNNARGGLDAAIDRAGSRVGHTAASGRYHRLPKKLQDDYEVQSKELGRGYNGSVFLAKSQMTGEKFAVKGFHLCGISAEKRKELTTECEIFLSMDHPHVTRLTDVYEDEKELHLVMECMTGGELFERILKEKVFSERAAAVAIRQMLLALNYLHSNKVVHRDLKLENFLYDKPGSDHLKLIDFGFSKVWSPNVKMAVSCGTLSYVAPEVLEGDYDHRCDLWSLGVIAFILLAGYMPFSGSEERQCENILQANYSWRPDKWNKVDGKACHFVRNLLTKDADCRMTAEEALNHDFIVGDSSNPEDGKFDNEMATALCEFASASKFRKACMSMMAWCLTNEERSQVRDAFLELDQSKQGTITLVELREVLTTKFQLHDEKVQPIFDALDTTNDDRIHYSEFLAAMVSTRIRLHDDLLMNTFKRFDVDNTNYISLENLREVLGKNHDGTELEDLLKEADTSGDGQISYQEFMEYLKGGDAFSHHAETAARIVDSELQAAEPDDGTRPHRALTAHQSGLQKTGSAQPAANTESTEAAKEVSTVEVPQAQPAKSSVCALL